LDEGKELVELGQDECVFGGEELLLFLKNFEVTGAASNIAIRGDFDCDLVRLDGHGPAGRGLRPIDAEGTVRPGPSFPIHP
jgi:hypothetical protein